MMTCLVWLFQEGSDILYGKEDTTTLFFLGGILLLKDLHLYGLLVDDKFPLLILNCAVFLAGTCRPHSWGQWKATDDNDIHFSGVEGIPGNQVLNVAKSVHCLRDAAGTAWEDSAVSGTRCIRGPPYQLSNEISKTLFSFLYDFFFLTLRASTAYQTHFYLHLYLNIFNIITPFFLVETWTNLWICSTDFKVICFLYCYSNICLLLTFRWYLKNK